MTSITSEQYAFLTAPIQPGRVQQLRGNSHLEAWDVRRHLIRAFGFDGFDVETKGLDLVREIEIPGAQPGKSRWTVVYRAEVRLTIKVNGQPVAVFEDAASGDSCNQPSLGDAHDMAMKTALSQGLKRCAVNLGDQFGLSLYNDGKTTAVVQRSLVAPEAPAAPVELGKDDEPVKPEQAAPVPVSAPPAPPVQVPPVVKAPEYTPPAEDLEREPDDGAEREQLPATPAAVPGGMMTDTRKKRMFALFGELGQTDKDMQLKFMNWACKTGDNPITSRAELTAAECETVIKALEKRKRDLATGAARPGSDVAA